MFIDLAAEIRKIHWHQAFAIVDGHVLEISGVDTPQVYNSDDTDIELTSRAWDCFHGMTHQWGYGGAVMHPSEGVSPAIAEKLYDYTMTHLEDGVEVIYAMIPVHGDPGESDAGWAIAYREKRMRSKQRECETCGAVWNSNKPVRSCKYDADSMESLAYDMNANAVTFAFWYGGTRREVLERNYAY